MYQYKDSKPPKYRVMFYPTCIVIITDLGDQTVPWDGKNFPMAYRGVVAMLGDDISVAAPAECWAQIFPETADDIKWPKTPPKN